MIKRSHHIYLKMPSHLQASFVFWLRPALIPSRQLACGRPASWDALAGVPVPSPEPWGSTPHPPFSFLGV